MEAIQPFVEEILRRLALGLTRLGDIAAYLLTLPRTVANWIWNTFTEFVLFIATWLAAKLPMHNPINLPELAWLKSLLKGFAMVNQLAPVPELFAVFAIILIVEGAIGIYALWRAVLGLIPFAK